MGRHLTLPLLAGLLALSGCGDDAPSLSADGGNLDAGPACATDMDCDDGRYCNGTERCEPGEGADARGCMAGVPPCGAERRCDEESDRCVTRCLLNADADGDGFEDVACGGADCDDGNPNVAPGMPEVCDLENLDEDCDPRTFGHRDADGDGFVDAACCNADGETLYCGDDCSDSRRDMRPGFAETCDFLDNDCDGEVDERVALDGFVDLDRDLHGDPGAPMRACPGQPGFATVSDDCDDADPEVHGAQLELCDSKDNDCDGSVDETMASVTWYVDGDGDGFGADDAETMLSCTPVEGFVTRSGDCDDEDGARSFVADEMCNAIDDDCDGVADFEVAVGDFEDDDGDGFADIGCGGDDCDDRAAGVFPGAAEACDGVDNDCDGDVDEGEALLSWYLDLDGDGYGDETRASLESCDPQPMRVPRGGDCDDRDAFVRPGVADRCDGVDSDCNGAIDEDVPRQAYYIDVDRDGWGRADASVVFACTAGPGRAERAGDCDDRRRESFPEATERCDEVDNDCDGVVDEGAAIVWYRDSDGDGRGDRAMTLEQCDAPPGYVELGGDCDDTNEELAGGLEERCNGRDDDCDERIDENPDALCPVPGGRGMCDRGVCELVSCEGRRRDCDDDYRSGCEADLDRDPTNCGVCGNACGGGDTCGRVTPGMCDDALVAELSAGDAMTYLFGSTGAVLGWGNNTAGQAIGVGESMESYVATPRPVEGLWLSLASGSTSHACGVRLGERVWCWGENRDGVLGRDDCRNTDGSRRICESSRGVPVPALMDEALQVDVGGGHSCALRRSGSVWCWGAQDDGRLGDGVIDRSGWREVPIRVLALSNVEEIEAGIAHTCARHRIGGSSGYRVSCWGANGFGQLGDGTQTSSAIPRQVLGLPADVVSLSDGYANTSCAVLGDGTARCWGASGYGATASGDTSREAPTPGAAAVTDAGGIATGIVSMCTGQYLSCALRRQGAAAPGTYSVWCAGHDDVGQLGDGDSDTGEARARLQPVVDESGGAPLDDAVAVACGRRHACAARPDGSVLCWGGDSENQIGEGSDRGAEFHTPVVVIEAR